MPQVNNYFASKPFKITNLQRKFSFFRFEKKNSNSNSNSNSLSLKMTSSSSDTTTSSLTAASIDKTAITTVANDPSTIKKGLLWQQRDRFFSRWKERYFVLTKDYLACFKKGSKVGISEMGSFMYKVMFIYFIRVYRDNLNCST